MEKIVLRYRKKGYTQTQLEAAAQAFAQAKGLRDANMQVYNHFEEITVFGIDGDGKKAEVKVIRRLRGELNFDNINALKFQIEVDVARVRRKI